VTDLAAVETIERTLALSLTLTARTIELLLPTMWWNIDTGLLPGSCRRTSYDVGNLDKSGRAGWCCPFSSSSLSSRCMTQFNICSILVVEDEEDNCCLLFNDGS